MKIMWLHFFKKRLIYEIQLAEEDIRTLSLLHKKLIREEYMSEEISLNVVAARVCMSPSYFSTIFSKETGKTFIEYLTEVRMEKAKEYLVCTNRKTSDIAFEIGYKDPHYFSFLFKKHRDVL